MDKHVSVKDKNSCTQSVIDRRKMSLMDKKLVAKDLHLFVIDKNSLCAGSVKDQAKQLEVNGVTSKDALGSRFGTADDSSK